MIRAGQTRQLTIPLAQVLVTAPELPIVVSVRQLDGGHLESVLVSVALRHHTSHALLAIDQPALRVTHNIAGSAVLTLAKPPRVDGSGLPILFFRELCRC